MTYTGNWQDNATRLCDLVQQCRNQWKAPDVSGPIRESRYLLDLSRWLHEHGVTAPQPKE